MYRIETFGNNVVYIKDDQLLQEMERYEGNVDSLPNKGYRFTTGNDGATDFQ